MLVSTVLTSKDNERVSGIESIEAAGCRVNNRDQVLVLACSHEDLELNQGSCSERT